MPVLRIVEGWTGPLAFQLTVDDVPLPLTTAETVKSWLFDKLDAEVDTSSGRVTIVTATCGEVSYSPTSTSTLRSGLSPYSLRFRVTDVAGKHVYFPSDEPWRLEVQSV